MVKNDGSMAIRSAKDACDELGVETAPAEVAAGVFLVPMFSWYSRDFVPRERRKEMICGSVEH